jgi:hypothetical protein
MTSVSHLYLKEGRATHATVQWMQISQVFVASLENLLESTKHA